MSMQTRLTCVVLLAASLTAVSSVHAKRPPPQPVFDVVRVTQAYDQPLRLAGDPKSYLNPDGSPGPFLKAVNTACKTYQPEIAGPLAAAAGLLVDWLFKSAITKLNARVQKSLEAYAANYSNDLVFGDILAQGWKDVSPELEKGEPKVMIEQTCVIAQRIICEGNTSKTPKGTCEEPERAANSVAFLLNRKGPAIRVLPIAFDIQQIRAKHAGKEKFAASYSLKIHALGIGPQGGYRWDSGEAVVISESFDLGADDTKPKYSKTDYAIPTSVSGLTWSKAKALPVPAVGRRGSYSAFQVTFAEVGQPRSYVKHFAAFLAANKDDVSKALGEAAKKKLKIGEE